MMKLCCVMKWPRPVLPIGRGGSQPQLRSRIPLPLLLPCLLRLTSFLMDYRVSVLCIVMNCRAQQVKQILMVPHSSIAFCNGDTVLVFYGIFTVVKVRRVSASRSSTKFKSCPLL